MAINKINSFCTAACFITSVLYSYCSAEYSLFHSLIKHAHDKNTHTHTCLQKTNALREKGKEMSDIHTGLYQRNVHTLQLFETAVRDDVSVFKKIVRQYWLCCWKQ